MKFEYIIILVGILVFALWAYFIYRAHDECEARSCPEGRTAKRVYGTCMCIIEPEE